MRRIGEKSSSKSPATCPHQSRMGSHRFCAGLDMTRRKRLADHHNFLSDRLDLKCRSGSKECNAHSYFALAIWRFVVAIISVCNIRWPVFYKKKTVGKKVRRDLYTCNGTSTQMKCTYQNEINNQQNKYIIVCIMNLCWGRLMWVCLRIIYFCWVSWKIAFKASRLKTLCASICRRCISRVFLGALFWRGWSSRKRSCRSWRSSSFQWNGPTSVVELLSFEMLFSCEHLWICEPLKVSSFWLLHVAVAYCSIFWRLHRFLVQNSNPGRRPLPLNQRRESAGLWKIPMMCHQMTTCQWMEGGIQVRFHQTPLSTSTTFHRTLVSTLMRFRQILMLTSSQRRNMRKPMGREKVSDP